MAIFSPTSRLSRVDLPTLGRPTRATKPARWTGGVNSSRLTAESHGCAVWPLRASGTLFISPDCRIARLCGLAPSRLRRSFHLALLPNRTVVRFGLFAPPALFSSRLTAESHGCAVWPLRASGALFISPDCRIARLCALASSRLRRSFHLALLPNRTVVRFGLFAPPALIGAWSRPPSKPVHKRSGIMGRPRES